MFVSIFSDELGLDVEKALPVIKSWGLEHIDLRGRIFGKHFEGLDDDDLARLRKLLDGHGMKVGCLQSSLAKVHLPDAERQQAEAEKLEAIIRAADALDCRVVRSFHYWQPSGEDAGQLAVRPDEQQKVIDMFRPLADRAKAAGLILAFENCGVTPAEAFTILDMLDEPSWGMAWDCCNSWGDAARSRDEDAYIARMVLRSRLIHVKATGAVDAIPDTELIPYDKVLQACDNAGLAGPVSAETHNPIPDELDSVEMSERTVRVIQRAWPTAAPGTLDTGAKRERETVRAWADDPVGFVVVGLGMGHSRSRMVRETSGARLIGVCDIVEERAKRTSDEFGVPYSLDVREWLDNDEVEAVFILTETGRHGEVALQAIEAGKHVMVTKPMDATLEACDQMIRKAEEKGVVLAVDFDRRHEPNVQELKRGVESGAFGRLLSGSYSLKILRTMDYYQANGGWRGTRRWDGGGVLANQSIHEIDVLAHVLGVPQQVRCFIRTQTHDIEAEDMGQASWLYGDDMLVTYFGTSSYAQKTWYAHLELEGTEAAYLRASGGPFLGAAGQSEDLAAGMWFLDGAWTSRPPETVEPEWLNSVDNFAAHLRTGAPLTCDGRDGRRTQSILDAMYRSAYEAGGDWVDVEPELAG